MVEFNKKGTFFSKIIKADLKSEIIVNITLLVMASLLFLGVIVLNLQLKALSNAKLEIAEELALSISSSIKAFMAYKNSTDIKEDQLYINNVIWEFSKIPGIIEMEIVDEKGIIIADIVGNQGKKSRDKYLKKAIFTNKPNFKFLTKRYLLFFNQPYGLIYISPIFSKKGKRFFIKLFLSLEDVRTNLTQFQVLVLLFILIDGFIFIVFGIIFFSRVIVNPIKKLLYATQKLSDGNLEYRVEVKEKNEIGQLCQNFNQMAEALMINRDKLTKTISSLEMANKELKIAQKNIIEAEKMASLGRLSAGIAHEIGNPLGAALGYVRFLKGGIEDEEELFDCLNRIESELLRIDKIIRDMLDFARPKKPMIGLVDAHIVIERAISLMENQGKLKEVEVIKDFYPKLPKVKVDPELLRQVLINLFINAIDAMDQKGKLFIKTGIKDKEIFIMVEDTGSGIPPENIKKLFDPFFTTKPPHQGTGLGLSISLKIIESFGGKLVAENRKEGGARFTIFLSIPEDEPMKIKKKNHQNLI